MKYYKILPPTGLMRMLTIGIKVLIITNILILGTLVTYSQSKPIIDVKAINNWPTLRVDPGFPKISDDGRYFVYSIDNRPVGKKTAVVKSLTSSWKKELGAIDEAFFSSNSKYLIFQDNDTLEILNLGSSGIRKIKNVQSFKHVKGLSLSWIAYQTIDSKNRVILMNIVTNEMHEYLNVKEYFFDKNEKSFFITSDKGFENDCLQLNWICLKVYKNEVIFSSPLNADPILKDFSFDQSGNKLAFAVEVKGHTNSECSIWHYSIGNPSANEIISKNSMPVDSTVNIVGSPKFSTNSNWVFFELAEKQVKPKKIDSSLASVNIWRYNDLAIQPQQIVDSKNTRNFLAVYDLNSGKIKRLENEVQSLVTGPEMVTGDNVIIEEYGNSVARNWPILGYQAKYYLISLKNDTKILLNKDTDTTPGFDKAVYYKTIDKFSFSPKGKYLVYFNSIEGAFKRLDCDSHVTINLSKGINHSLLKDYMGGCQPEAVAGVAGYEYNETSCIIYDNYDLWKLDLTGEKPPVNLTHNYGINNDIKFRIINFEEGQFVYGQNQKLLLTGFNAKNKDNGIFSLSAKESKEPKPLIFGPKVYYRESSQLDHFYTFVNELIPLKAKNVNKWIVQIQSVNNAPNFYVTSNFQRFDALTELQPQKSYNWINSELISWEQLDGSYSQGILYKPENFDATKKYPVIFNYYEALSYRLNEFPNPGLTSANINIPWFVSRGYLVFTPDIHYQNAAKSNKTVGEWAYNSVVSAAKYLSNFSYVDSTKMALQGHSFGGLETAYLVTHSNIFAAAAENAGSTDPVSRYLTLMPFLDSLEHASQAASMEAAHEMYGASLWTRSDLYLRNSAVLNADKVTTPILIFHNNNDNQVQWRQGIEFYMALRNLGKKAWMLQYDGEGHDLVKTENQLDYTIRLTQFFDYYLKSMRPPVWMTRGVPAKMKGNDSGLALDTRVGATP